MKLEAGPWSFLDEYRGTMFPGEWPTLPELFAITATRHPDRPCFTSYDPDRRSLSYSQAREKVLGVAGALRAGGIGGGSKVALTGKNTPEWAVAYLGILETGATVVPIDYQLTTDEVANLVKASDSVAAFVDEERAAELQAACPWVPAWYSLYAGGRGYVLEMAPPAGKAPSPTPPVETDLAAILFTSGTTGVPKGVMLTHRNFVSDCFLAQANLTVLPTDVFYALLPIHHSYTMLAVFIEAISIGSEIVFGKRMVVKQILKDLKEAKVTMFLGVPMLFNKVLAGIMRGVGAKGPAAAALVGAMMAASGFVKKAFGINPGKRIFGSILEKASLSTIRICISGGGPLAPSIFRKYNQLGIDFVQGYGLTETSPILTLNPIHHYKETSVGKVIPGVEVRIDAPDASGIGEIVVRGPMVMAGYYRMPEETAEVLDAEGWLRTGDLGYLDSENYLYLTGRAKNLIVTEGGKNVYPEDIENRFQLFDEVEQVLVRGYLQDAELKSEGIEAVLYPVEDWVKDGCAGDRAKAGARMREIVETVNQGLLPYQRISRVTVLDSPMEMTTTKKVKRYSVAR